MSGGMRHIQWQYNLVSEVASKLARAVESLNSRLLLSRFAFDIFEADFIIPFQFQASK